MTILPKMHQIEVDEEVYKFLREHAEPFKDTPNSVVKRFLPLDGGEVETRSTDVGGSIPEFRPSVPYALAQILQVIFLVKNKGLNRVQATRIIANHRGITPQAIIDKYCRQLGKKSYEIDELLMEHGLSKFKSILTSRFPRNSSEITRILG